MAIVISGVTKRFGGLIALDNVSLNIEAGAFVCFLGPSGCGKTTLLRVVAGLEKANEGRIRVNGLDLAGTSAKKRNFGIVFQSYSLFPTLTAAQNVAYGLECRRWPRPDTGHRVDEMLKLVDLERHAGKLPHQMSGGQQQRVALARALAPKPSLLLLDEPLSALDAKVREDLRTEIKSLQRRLGVTTIMVTHDQEEALAMADVIVVMRDGRIEQVGTPGDLYERPKTDFVARFIGRMNFLGVRTDAEGCAWVGASPVRLGVVPPGTVHFCLRPEHVEICAPDQAGDNVMVGTVVGISFLGNLTRVTMKPRDDGGEVVAELHGRTAVPALDSQIAMRFSPEAVRGLS